jgi:hypothetical protein
VRQGGNDDSLPHCWQLARPLPSPDGAPGETTAISIPPRGTHRLPVELSKPRLASPRLRYETTETTSLARVSPVSRLVPIDSRRSVGRQSLAPPGAERQSRRAGRDWAGVQTRPKDRPSVVHGFPGTMEGTADHGGRCSLRIDTSNDVTHTGALSFRLDNRTRFWARNPELRGARDLLAPPGEGRW